MPPEDPPNLGRPQPADPLEPYRRVLEGTIGIPFTNGNHVRVLRNGNEIFPAMLAAIEAAKTRVEFLTFVYWTGSIAKRFASALADSSKKGVDVKVILDGWGARTMDDELVHRMQKAGVEVVWFRPPTTWRLWRIPHRTHRKVLVCDGEVGFTGGVGIAREWEGDARTPAEWRDTHFRIEGPAVHGLRAAFFDTWAETGRAIPDMLELIPVLSQPGQAAIQVMRSTGTVGWSDVATLLRVLIALSRKSLRITTAYFNPDDVAVDLLCRAARRGVEVEVVMPGPHTDSRVSQVAGEDEYTELLEAGVKLWRYQPTMIHAKVILVDGAVASVGSANFNRRSMGMDDEVAVTLLDPEVLGRLEADFAEDRARCAPVELRSWRRGGLVQRLREQFVASVEHHV